MQLSRGVLFAPDGDVVPPGLVGQSNIQILELVMDGFLDPSVGLPLVGL